MTDDPTTTAGARPEVGMYSVLSPDPQRLAAFWAELLDLPVTPGLGPDLAMLDLDHEVAPVTWIFERTEDRTAGPAPIGFDISNPDGADHLGLAERAEALGAERVADREEGGAVWVEMRDPDGNRFRIFGPRPT